jgi:hypothetical protein
MKQGDGDPYFVGNFHTRLCGDSHPYIVTRFCCNIKDLQK